MMEPVPARVVADHKAEWLRQHFEITPDELSASPPSFREYVERAWVMYWRSQCAVVMAA